jgi:hypothetical protein
LFRGHVLPLMRDGSMFIVLQAAGIRLLDYKRDVTETVSRATPVTVSSTIGAIAKTIDALRGIERWGSGVMLQQAFQGFIALPAPEQCWQVLGVSAHATKDAIQEAGRRLPTQHHPDRGGDAAEMTRANAARNAGLERGKHERPPRDGPRAHRPRGRGAHRQEPPPRAVPDAPGNGHLAYPSPGPPPDRDAHPG